MNQIIKVQFEFISGLKRRMSMNVYLYKIKIYQVALMCKMENEALTDFEQIRGKCSVSNIF